MLEYGAFICAWCMGTKYPRPPGVCGAVDVKYPLPPGVWGAVDVFLLVVIDIGVKKYARRYLYLTF